MKLSTAVFTAFAALTSLASLPLRADNPGERVVELPVTDGIRQRVLIVGASNTDKAIVMMPGGSGQLGIGRNGDLKHGDNFVVRTRAAWAARGYLVIIPDAADHENLRGQRSAARYATVVERLLTFAKGQTSGPVFLLGTSQGSIAAVNGAAHAPPGLLSGVILTESVSKMGGSGETVFAADPSDVRVPVLVVANRQDACDVAPPSEAGRIAKAFSRSPNVRVLYVDGGISRSTDSCGSLSPHGYYGIEPQVIDLISRWMSAQSSR